MQFHFILVEPAVPENIGASARAIKTMGFTHLRLVNTTAHLNEKALWVAHASNEILANAQHYPSLKEAIKDIDIVIASTAKKRRVYQDYIPSQEIATFLKDKKGTINNIGIVFGREESGLTNEEVDLCDIITRVPMTTQYPSLNLSQAVMIYAYEIAKIFKQNEPIENEPSEINTAEFNELSKRIKLILDTLNISKNPALSNRIIERINHLKTKDIRLLHSISDKLLKFINSNKIDL